MVYDFGVKSVLENYGSADMLMGSAESMEYYQSIREQYESMERRGVWWYLLKH